MYKIGDKVKLRGIVSGADLNCRSGTIGGIKEYDSLTTNIDSNGNFVEKYYYRGILYYIKEINWWVPPQNIIGYENLKKMKKIERPELDPYGEEDWGWEEIKESLSGYEFCVRVHNKEEFHRLMSELEERGYQWTLDRKPTNKYYDNGMKVIYCKSNKRLTHSGLEHYESKYKDKPLFSVNDFINFLKKMKKIERPELDPYGEEDWGWEETNEEFTEPKKDVIRSGDRVSFNGDTGVVVWKRGGHFLLNGLYLIKFDVSKPYYHDGRRGSAYDDGFISDGENHKYWYVGKGGSMGDLKLISIANRKRIERPDLDPYGEEDWGWEEIKENNSSPYSEEDWENESIIHENLFEPKNEFCVKVNNKEEFERLMIFFEEQGFSWHGLIKEPTAKEYSEGMEVVYSDPDGMLSYSNLSDYNFRYNSIPIYPVDIVINNKKYKKIENLEDDPYGEEDWGYEEIKENGSILKYQNFCKTKHVK